MCRWPTNLCSHFPTVTFSIMGSRVILRQQFIRFADFVRHSHFDWHTCLIISLRGFLCHTEQGQGNLGWKTSALIQLVGSSPVSLAWHREFGYPACKLLWPLLQWACISIFQTYGQKMKPLFFFSLSVCVSLPWMPGWKSHSSALPKLPDLHWMKSLLLGSSINWPGSLSCWFVLICDITKLITQSNLAFWHRHTA